MIKVNLFLCLIKYQAMKIYGGVKVLIHAFLTLALDGREWSTLSLSCFTPAEGEADTHCIEGWVSPRASMDMVENTKISASVGN